MDSRTAPWGIWSWRASALLSCACSLCPGVAAQRARTSSEIDPLIAVIETIKQSVVSIDCLAVTPTEAKVVERVGGGFLISESGDFVTAGHVLQSMQNQNDSCSTPAITLAVGGWNPEAPVEHMVWFQFKHSDCKIDRVNDVAACRLSSDPAARIRELHVRAVQFEWNIPPDGTQVAFTGFPLRSRDPVTFRAHVAAYRIPWPDESIPELVLDRPALGGFSGSPIYLANGRIIGLLVATGTNEAGGVTIARPVSAFREILLKPPAR